MTGCAPTSGDSAATRPDGRRMLRLEVRNAQTPIERKPEWIKTRAKMGPEYYECWEDREATFLIGGSQCTRRCDFCQIDTGKPADYDTDEPRRVAESVARMDLRYATVTGVARDDLPDGGAWLHAETVRAIHERNPRTGVEILATDFNGDPDQLDEVFSSSPEVFAHNVETVPRIFKRIRPAFRYERSLGVLTRAHRAGLITKSNLILGMGEEPEEVAQALRDLREAGTDIITITQYLRPSPRHLPVARWVKPEEFLAFKTEAERIGFLGVLAGPSPCGRWDETFPGTSPTSARKPARTASPRPSDALGDLPRGPQPSVGAGHRDDVAVGVEVHQQHIVRRVGIQSVLEHGERIAAAEFVREDGHAHDLQRPDDVDVGVTADVDEHVLEVVAERLLLLQDVLDHLAGAVAELGDHRSPGLRVDSLQGGDERGGDIERGGRDVVLIGSGEIDGHGLVAELDDLRPEERPVGAGLEKAEVIVLDRHPSMKPARPPGR